MDFTKLTSATRQRFSTEPARHVVADRARLDPIKVFESLPSLPDTPNDLWRGQASALTEWHAQRQAQDVLITLNTGAGKTIVGLLVAQSLVNERIENVVYVCSTIDLVRQTAREAERIGIDCTIRVQREFSDGRFESGSAFCVTTYAALLNGHSAIRRHHFPGAIVFDDAHVAESLLRDAFTIRIEAYRHPSLFDDIASFFEPHFSELGLPDRFAAALDESEDVMCLAAPDFLQSHHNQLRAILNDHDVANDSDLTFPYAWLRDRLGTCAVVFGRAVIEFTPPFLPSRALDIFGSQVRRVYLSATLESLVDFVRAFGREPDHVIKPDNDAGNGERLFINGGSVGTAGFDAGFAAQLTHSRKAVIAVGSRLRAKPWAEVAVPPARGDFTDALDGFRKASTGAFVLVSRVDGIDLPNETCRIMLVDGLPSGVNLLERFQWDFLRMTHIRRLRTANRLTQLFGRINRGRNDYGVFLVQGRVLNSWLANDRNLALLSPLLQQQILIGRHVQESFDIRDEASAFELIDRVLGRDRGWLDYYQQEVTQGFLDSEHLARHRTAEPALLAAAVSEALYAEAMWNGDPQTAWRELEGSIDQTSQHDSLLAGWHAVWLGAAYCLAGDPEAGHREYARAMRRLGTENLALPRQLELSPSSGSDALNPFGQSLDAVVSYTQGPKYRAEFDRLQARLSDIELGSANQAEEAVRSLGEALGFRATRPDNDEGTGPDVVWADVGCECLLAFELKTRKQTPARYNKRDIGQGHDHLAWLSQEFPAYDVLGLMYVGPDGDVSDKANPSEKMVLCLTRSLASLRDRLAGVITDLRGHMPLVRHAEIAKVSSRAEWTLAALAQTLRHRSFA